MDPKVGTEAGPQVLTAQTTGRTAVDDFWGQWTVRSEPFKSAEESSEYLKWRASIYPLFSEYMEIYGDHSGEVVLDYGCGPGNDTVGFLISSNAKKIIGLDVSQKALSLASLRINLHEVDPSRVELILSSDGTEAIPLDDGAVDYIHCLGVIHHTTHPGHVLRELARVLKPGGRGSIMVYNRQSIFFHLWVAYQRQIVNGDFPGLDADSAFSKATDGEDCPISRPYRPEDFVELCLAAGLETEFVGGYFASMELDLMGTAGSAAMADKRLGVEHRNFLASLTKNEAGFYLHKQKTAGHGGVYSIRKPR
jgi:SAM-dependent methyltransferase